MNTNSENKTVRFEEIKDIEVDLIGIVKRRFPLILLGSLFGAVGAALFYLTQISVYESELVVLVGQRSSELTSTGRVESEPNASLQEQILATHIELFSSPRIINDAIAQLKLKQPLREILNALKVTKGGSGLAKNASVLKATYQDSNAANGVRIISAIYESYRKFLESQSKNVGAEAVELIAKSQVKNEEELRLADEEYRNFVKSVPAFIHSHSNGSDELNDIHRIRLSKLEAELATIRSVLAETRSRYEVVKGVEEGMKVDEISDITIMSLLTEKEVSRIAGMFRVLIDERQTTSDQLNVVKTSESVRTEYQRLTELVSKERVLAETFGEQHPTVRSTQLEIAAIRDFLQKQRSELPDEERAKRATPAQILFSYNMILKNEVAELEKREKELVILSAQEAKEAKELETTFLLGNSLKSKMQRAQTRYDEVFKRLQEISLTNEYVGFSTDLIASPVPAKVPIWPSKIKIVAIGMFIGLLLGMTFALLAESADRTFRSPDDVESAVGSKILVHTPRIQFSEIKRRISKTSKLAPTMATFHAPRGMDAENYRVLRTILLFRGNKNSQNVFLLTSPSPGDGKSTTISNLAISLAQTGKKVLLVDADLRRPSISKNFGIPKRIGLTDFLKNNFDELGPYCLESEQENLDICADGSTTHEPSELLESTRFKLFLDLARAAYDIVLIDSPPVLAVADPAIISNLVDGCLLTVRIEKNNRTLVERACEILADQEANLLGLIVNSRVAGNKAFRYSTYDFYGQKEYGYQAGYRNYYAASEPPKNGMKANRGRNGKHPVEIGKTGSIEANHI